MLQDEELGKLHHGPQQSGVLRGELKYRTQPDEKDVGGQELSADVHAVHATPR